MVVIIIKNKRTKEENSDWFELCGYVKSEIFKYDSSMKFPKYLALRLMGLSQGKYIANNAIENQAKYTFKIILCTFKVCRSKIHNYIHSNQTKIQDEKHKINLIMKFVEDEINDVYIRYQAAEEKDKKIENLELNNQQNQAANYTSKTTDSNDKLNKLW